MPETDSDGYVVSHLHETNKREGQSLAGGIPTQHCAGKGSLLYPCAKLARARKSNQGSAKPEVISPDGRQHIFSQLSAAVTPSVGLERRESEFVSAWRVGATGLHLPVEYNVETHASFLSDSLQQHGLEYEGYWREERKANCGYRVKKLLPQGSS